MKTVKVSEATPEQLNWLVMKLEFIRRIEAGEHVKAWVLERHAAGDPCGSPATDWSQGGPIIDREKIGIEYTSAANWHAAIEWLDEPSYTEIGPTPLVAAMRCYVSSKFGDTVEVPEELK